VSEESSRPHVRALPPPGAHVGLCANPKTVNQELVHAVDLLHA
jgi:hypothetical protein